MPPLALKPLLPWIALVSVGGCVTTPATVTPPSPVPVVASVESSPLAPLAFMAGHWRDIHDGGVQEEGWFAPQGKLMVGVSREMRPDGRQYFEFLRIEARDEGIVYVAQPQGGPEVHFALAETGPQRALFTSPMHDFPRTIEYSRAGDTLRARLEGVEKGQPLTLEYSWRKQ